MTLQYLPVAIMFVLAAIVVAVMVNAGRLLGPRNKTAVKMATFECGNEPSGSAWGRFSVKFYLTAILFIIFDVEVDVTAVDFLGRSPRFEVVYHLYSLTHAKVGVFSG